MQLQQVQSLFCVLEMAVGPRHPVSCLHLISPPLFLKDVTFRFCSSADRLHLSSSLIFF